MPVHFIVSGQKTFVERVPEGVRTDHLAPKLYSLEFDSSDNSFYLLNIADKFILPDKIYGNYDQLSERVIKTYFNRKENTGVLLSGLKGSGKTLFSRIIANKMIEKGFPVIQINKIYPGEEILNFIENIGNCVLIFDEFGKKYQPKKNFDGDYSNTQYSLLNLLDGLGNSKRLHILIENTMDLVSDYLLCRPGRIYYHFRYDRLKENVIRDYCRDLGIPEKVIKELLDICPKIRTLNFDTINCLINEWKLYGGKLADHLEILNIGIFEDPNENKTKLISFTKANGEKLDPKDAVLNLTYDNLIYIEFLPKDEKTEYYKVGPVSMRNIVSVKDDFLTFVTNAGDTFVLKINKNNY